jgi:hypothetical protein
MPTEMNKIERHSEVGDGKLNIFVERNDGVRFKTDY